MKQISALLLAGVLAPVVNAHAEEVSISFANLAGMNGVALSPVFIGLSNNPTPVYTPGSLSSAAVTQLAETGSGAGLAGVYGNMNGVQTAEVTAMSHAFGPGIYLPGANGSITLNLDPAKNMYLDFYAMVVPSNDRFISGELQLFNSMGQFVGGNLTLNGNAVWDAGAVASQLAGAAFLVNNSGGNKAINGVITVNSDFSVYANQLTPAGYTFTNLPTDNTPLLSVNAVAAVPEPAMSWLMISSMWLFGWAQRKKISTAV